ALCYESYLCSLLFFFSSRRRHTRSKRDWSSDVCSSDLRLESFMSPAFQALSWLWLLQQFYRHDTLGRMPTVLRFLRILYMAASSRYSSENSKLLNRSILLTHTKHNRTSIFYFQT